ncbi:hypothetical protein DXD95_10580 [Agathobacter rectalis]|uniref:Flagellin C-terminal domain-containing protein n=1 Tax=Agathobacter rectalis TaxID=39491 RepID=A0A3E4E7X1_9FIRM|nr:hypothetical protein DXD95_10580 [Agathobacter rectalis]
MHQREATKYFSPTIPWEEGNLRRLIEISGNSDTDMADEMTRFSKESILQQAATSMLAQAEDE